MELEYTGAKPGVVAFLAERTRAPATGIAGGGSGAAAFDPERVEEADLIRRYAEARNNETAENQP